MPNFALTGFSEVQVLAWVAKWLHISGHLWSSAQVIVSCRTITRLALAQMGVKRV
jgi:hypothetical protein